MFNNYNPYYNNYQPNRYLGVPQNQPTQPMQMPMEQQNAQPRASLLGEFVDNLDMVTVSKIPLDGSTVFFPLSDGSAIATKQLQMDGKSKITVYKPIELTKENAPQYLTKNDLQDFLGNFDINDFNDMKKELDTLKKQIKEFSKKEGK